jgi:hypothetical protein
MPVLNLAMRQVRHACVSRKKPSNPPLTTHLTHLTHIIEGMEWCGGVVVGGVRGSIETHVRCVSVRRCVRQGADRELARTHTSGRFAAIQVPRSRAGWPALVA